MDPIPGKVVRSVQQTDQDGEEHANAVGHDAAAIEQALAAGASGDELVQPRTTNPPVRKPV